MSPTPEGRIPEQINSSYDLAVQWLEQQQRQQQLEQHRLVLNHAILGSQPTHQLPQQSITNQQLSGILPLSSNYQHAYLHDAHRQRQQEATEQGNTSNNTLLQHNLDQLLVSSRAQEVEGAELNRLLAAESLVMQRRTKMEEAVRMIQLQGLQGTMQDAIYRGDTMAGLSIPTGPILPLNFLTTNSAPQQNLRMLPAIFHHGHLGVLPLSLQSPFRSGDSPHSKRKAEEQDTELGKESGKKRALPSAANCCPLPSRKQARIITIKLTSYRALWDELEESEMQEEIFRRRIFQGIKTRGKSRSVKILS